MIDYWFLNDSRVDQDVLEAVAELRSAGDRVYLATNEEHMRANYLMKIMGLKNHADGIFYFAALGNRKPMREFFAHATGTIACAPFSITLIENTEENVLAARAYGWNAVHWKSGVTVAQELSALTP